MIEDRKEKGAAANQNHQMRLVNRESMTLDGVTAMGSYNDAEIFLDTIVGALSIKGENLHIKQLNLDEGKMEVEGSISSLSYSEAGIQRSGKGFLSKLLR